MKTLLVIAWVLIVAAVGVAWHASNVTVEANAAFAAAAQKAGLADQAAAQTAPRLADAERDAAEAQAALAALHQARAAETATQQAQPSPAVRAQALAARLAKGRAEESQPISQLREVDNQRRRLAVWFRPLFTQLGLSPAEIEKFIAVDRKQLETDLDIRALKAQGLLARRDDPAEAKLTTEARAEADAAYRQLLGETGFQQFAEFRRTLVAREILSGFAGVAVLAGTSFTAPQLEQLVQVLAGASGDYRSGQAMKWSGIDWEAADRRLRPLMSDAQWTLFQTVDVPFGGTQNFSRSFTLQEKAVQAEAESRAKKIPGG